jgi:hypothetical protein
MSAAERVENVVLGARRGPIPAPRHADGLHACVVWQTALRLAKTLCSSGAAPLAIAVDELPRR